MITGSPTQSTGVNTVPQKTSSLSPDQALGGTHGYTVIVLVIVQ